MTRLLLMIGAAAMAVAAPAAAQHQHHGHHMPAPKKAAPKKAAPKKAAPKKAAPKKAAAKKARAKVPAKKPAAKKAPPKKAPPKKAPPKKADVAKPAATDPHAGHQMPATPADPHAGHQMPATPADPHAGHQMPGTPADPHAGHAMPPAAEPPIAPPPAEAFSGPENAADLFWDRRAMGQSRRWMRREHGGLPAYRVLVDRAEARLHKGPNAYALDGEAWFGGDIDKLWVKAESEGELGRRFDGAELQALWSHAVDPWFDLQAGVRYDPQRGRDRAHLVAGVQGLAPYWIEVDAAAFLSDQGDLTARLEAEHDVRITQQLVLQPRGELDFAFQNVPSERIGAGLSTLSLGARLRYQVRPEFAPYVGLQYDRAVGRTRRLARDDGDDVGGMSVLAGLRLWF